jgi:hypothetical protein
MAKSKSTPDPDASVDFAQMLEEELAEIERLRSKREWTKGHDRFHYDGHGGGFQLVGEERPARHASSQTEHKVTEALPGVPSADNVFQRAHEEALVGLAFSGGGIRSATFNLGVLQGLAKLGLLPMFDYLSTVSGGGYIGGWLSAWIFHRGQDVKAGRCKEGGDHPPPIRTVQESLKPDRSEKPGHAEPRPIRFLREYSNYLTPRLGFLGADTWTAIAIYTRNLFLNQLILISFLAAILLLPHMIGCFTRWTISLTCLPWFLAPGSSFILISLALSFIAINMYNLTGVHSGPESYFQWYARQGWVVTLVAFPLLIAAWIASAWLWQEASGWLRTGWPPLWQWMLAGIVVFGGAWTVASFLNLPRTGPAAPHWSKTAAWVWSSVFSFISGCVGGILLWVLTKEFFLETLKTWPGAGVWHAVSFGTPLLMLIFLLVGALQIGLIGLYFPDPRREWWSRLGGYLLIISIVWTAAFAASIYSPLGLMWLNGKVRGGLGLGWLGATLTGIFGGKSSKTGGAESFSWRDTALSVTPYVFIVGLASGIALLLEACLAVLGHSTDNLWKLVAGSPVAQKVSGWVFSLDVTVFGNIHGQGTMTPQNSANPAAAYVQAHWAILHHETCCGLLFLFGALLAICAFLSWRVNLNEFSMNLFYRNRLVRAYLGASHAGRRPNPFTGFDPHDELQLKDLRSDQCYSGPFPIVNSALNLVSGKDLAWQERKAESFVLTPLRCGFDTWLEQMGLRDEGWPTNRPRKIQEYAFRPTESYGFRDAGLRLGTAMSISGAAASPNMGYHSSPSLAFLMTLFNVRLGFWAGNPRHNFTWTKPGPQFGLLYLLAELFGQTDDEARYVYLSDAGHFENLGIYELVKRRCKFIVACDAGADPNYEFGDLGSAIRKCREDIGIEIRLKTNKLVPKTGRAKCTSGGTSQEDNSANDRERFSKLHWAVGTICYNLVDPGATEGILVYLKASMTNDEPADVLNYHREHSDFPHQTTADQWFTESQFESYRRLGQHVVMHLFRSIGEPVPPSIKKGSQPPRPEEKALEIPRAPTKDIFEALRTKWCPVDQSCEEEGESARTSEKKTEHSK